MLKQKSSQQLKIEIVCLENLVPQNHILRKISKYVDFEFIRKKTEHFYCKDNGRPALDPVVMFKMLFIGYLFGIRSERQLMREIQVNVAYRWFLGMDFSMKVPDASTISKARHERFKESTIYQEIFDEIVFFAMRKKLVDGKILYTDSTHLKANANKNKFIIAEVQKNTRSYIEELDKDIAISRDEHGKNPLKPRSTELETKQVKQSTTDPDSGFMVRDGKPRGFYFLDHRTVDSKFSLITDSHVTPANVHDSLPYLERLDRQQRQFGFDIQAVGLDAGYNTAAICKGLEDRNIFSAIAYRSNVTVKDKMSKKHFYYDYSIDCYICPNNCLLRYRTTNRDGYKEYVSNYETCKSCDFLNRCTSSRNHTKVITRHVWEDSRERANNNRLSEYGKQIYKRRKETVERSFADSKQLHGHRYAKMRGLDRLREQCLLCAWASNIKKIAFILSRKDFFGGSLCFFSILHALLYYFSPRVPSHKEFA